MLGYHKITSIYRLVMEEEECEWVGRIPLFLATEGKDFRMFTRRLVVALPAETRTVVHQQVSSVHACAGVISAGDFTSVVPSSRSTNPYLPSNTAFEALLTFRENVGSQIGEFDGGTARRWMHSAQAAKRS